MFRGGKRAQAFGDASFGKGDNGECKGHYVVFVQKAQNGVLQKEQIERWDLPNLDARSEHGYRHD